MPEQTERLGKIDGIFMKRTALRLLLGGFSLLLLCGGESYAETAADTAARVSFQDRHDMMFQMRGSWRAAFPQGNAPEYRFRMDNFRWNVEGRISDRLYYHFRQSLTAGFQAQSFDGLLSSVDYAYLKWGVTDRLSLKMGKQVFAFGGQEFWAAPVYVLQFTDFGGSVPCYQMGVSASWNLSPAQEIVFQAANLRGTGDDAYFTGGLPDGVEPARAPFLYTVNWNGSFLDRNALEFRYAVSWGNQATGRRVWFVTLGQAFRHRTWGCYLDFNYSRQDLDVNGLMSRSAVFADGNPRTLEYVEYYTVCGYFHWRFHPAWAMFLKGAREYGALYRPYGDVPAGLCRANWNAQYCLEYLPTRDPDFRFFLHYNFYDLTAEGSGARLGMKDFREHRLSLGLIYIMPVF